MSETTIIERPTKRARAISANGSPDLPSKPPVQVQIQPPKFERATLLIRGTAPYLQNKFSAKARLIIEETQRAGSRAQKGKKREPRDFEGDYEQAKHLSTEGWAGIPAPAFRNALISACRLAGFAMTRAKLSLFIEADGFDFDDGTPLVRITKGEAVRHEGYARNASGVVDLRWRPLWREGWEAMVSLRWDADQFSAADVVNLLSRAGLQVGVGEGRPDSPNSNGLGFGTFDLIG